MAKFKTTNDKGEEVEVEAFTSDEVATQIAAKESDFATKIKEKEDAVAALSKERDDLAAKAAGTKEDHPNFKALKEALVKKDEEIKSVNDRIAASEKAQVKEKMDAKVATAAKGNAEKEKKIKLHLTSTLAAMPESNEQERNAKIEAAIKLSADYGDGAPGIMDGVMANGVSAGQETGNESVRVEFTAREKALGAKLGITAEDYKKFGPKLKNK